MKWFGTNIGALICKHAEEQVSVPVGELCNLCGNKFIDVSTGVVDHLKDGTEQPLHMACFRLTICPSPDFDQRARASIQIMKEAADLFTKEGGGAASGLEQIRDVHVRAIHKRREQLKVSGVRAREIVEASIIPTDEGGVHLMSERFITLLATEMGRQAVS